MSNFGRKCTIRYGNKYHKEKLLPLCNIILKQVESELCKAEKKLIKFAHIHINKNNLKDIEAENIILLTKTSKSSFAVVRIISGAFAISVPLGEQLINELIMNQGKAVLIVIHCCTN